MQWVVHKHVSVLWLGLWKLCWCLWLFLFYVSLLCIKYIFVYVVISPPPFPPAKQIMHQPMELSEFKVLELFFSSFVCAPFVLMKPEEQITRSEDTDDTGFWKCDLNRRWWTPGHAKVVRWSRGEAVLSDHRGACWTGWCHTDPWHQGHCTSQDGCSQPFKTTRSASFWRTATSWAVQFLGCCQGWV